MESSNSSYGVKQTSDLLDDVDLICEEIRIQGYSIIPDVFDKDTIQTIKDKILNILKTQENEFGIDNLKLIHDLNIVRSPLVYDDYFLNIAMNETVQKVVSKMLGEYHILHLQSAIVNKPTGKHHQALWHRDLPYQHFTSSAPLAISALMCIDNFSEETGGTIVLPFSHKVEYMPSEQYTSKFVVQVEAKAGSVILFDSMLFHKAGNNTSNQVRVAINNVYVLPFIKQQIDLPIALGGKYSDDPKISKFLGYDSHTPPTVSEYRNIKLNKLK